MDNLIALSIEKCVFSKKESLSQNLNSSSFWEPSVPGISVMNDDFFRQNVQGGILKGDSPMDLGT